MYAACKRVLDYFSALAGIVILGPLLAVVAIAIKLDSKGSVFYLGERVGRRNRKFKIIKFRTMRPNAEILGTTTSQNDPRITGIGDFLRKSKIDELPQLFNILRGDMSLVGPRPEVEEHTREYSDEEKLILTVPPGITDYSSIHFFNLGDVLGAENAHEMYLTKYRDEKNQLRLKYVRNRSFVEDLRILMLTFRTIALALLRRSGGKG